MTKSLDMFFEGNAFNIYKLYTINKNRLILHISQLLIHRR